MDPEADIDSLEFALGRDSATELLEVRILADDEEARDAGGTVPEEDADDPEEAPFELTKEGFLFATSGED